MCFVYKGLQVQFLASAVKISLGNWAEMVIAGWKRRETDAVKLGFKRPQPYLKRDPIMIAVCGETLI